jgi:hypothetical protein
VSLGAVGIGWPPRPGSEIKLYVCYTRRNVHIPLVHQHSCAKAYEALRFAGHDPEVVHAYSFGGVPGALQTPQRKRVREHTGSYWVPALETDSGEWISGSETIVDWAERHPVGD